jgi:hypothetical protein
LRSNFKAEVLWDACYRVSSLINQFIASSRVLNLGEIAQREGTSGGCQKTLNGLSPLSGWGIFGDDFTGPSKRKVGWGPNEKGNSLPGTCLLDLLVDIGLPKKSRCGDLFASMHFDSMTPQNGSAHLTRSLAAINEENFLASKNRAATKQWWIIHNHTSETRAPSLEG